MLDLNRRIPVATLSVIINIVFVILGSVLSSALIVEITESGLLNWNKVLKANSFWFLIIFVVIYVLWNRYLYNITKSIENFKDDSFCKAFIRSQAIPALANLYREQVRKGNYGGSLIDIENDLRKWANYK